MTYNFDKIQDRINIMYTMSRNNDSWDLHTCKIRATNAKRAI